MSGCPDLSWKTHTVLTLPSLSNKELIKIKNTKRKTKKVNPQMPNVLMYFYKSVSGVGTQFFKDATGGMDPSRSPAKCGTFTKCSLFVPV